MNRRAWSSIAGVLTLGITATAPAAEWYVDASSAGGAPQGTQANPFRSVQAAINAAATGDEILVAAGTYVENLRIEGKALALKGGFSSAWVRDLTETKSVLTGAGRDAVLTLIESDSTVEGFRITGGTGSVEDLPYVYNGGGIYSRDGSPTIANNIIENNDIRSVDPAPEYALGGGIYVTNATTATIINNVVRRNFAGRGAGISVDGQAALIQGNTIEDNVAVGDHGGGMYIATVRATITQNLIRRNEVGRALGYGWGGGVIFFGVGNSAEIAFNVLTGNFAAAYGSAEFIDEGASASIHHELIYGNLSKEGCEAVSAIAVDGGDGVGSRATISHCTVVNNVCPDATRGNGLQVEGGSVANVVNSIFWNNGGDDFAVFDTSRLTVTYTCSQERIAGTGNISADPRFVNAAANDYRLGAGSPCIDAGDPASPFDNEPANNGGRADMGRFGNASDASSPGSPIDGGSGSAGGSASGANPGGGSSTGGTGSNPGNDVGDSSHHDVTDPQEAFVPSAAVCPSAGAMMLMLPLIGARRTPRRRADSAVRS